MWCINSIIEFKAFTLELWQPFHARLLIVQRFLLLFAFRWMLTHESMRKGSSVPHWKIGTWKVLVAFSKRRYFKSFQYLVNAVAVRLNFNQHWKRPADHFNSLSNIVIEHNFSWLFCDLFLWHKQWYTSTASSLCSLPHISREHRKMSMRYMCTFPKNNKFSI